MLHHPTYIYCTHCMVGESTGIKTLTSEFSGCETPNTSAACFLHPYFFISQLTTPSSAWWVFQGIIKKERPGHVAHTCIILSWLSCPLGCSPIPTTLSWCPWHRWGCPLWVATVKQCALWAVSDQLPRVDTKRHFSPSRTPVEHFWGIP